MGTRRGRTRQATLWVPTADRPKRAGHPLYERLHRVLDEAGFDAFVEAPCASCYAAGVGRPRLAPGRSVRLLLLGSVDGLDSERAIAWRAADSLSIRTFLDVALHEAPPDHATLSRTRRLIDLRDPPGGVHVGAAAAGRRHAGRGAHGGDRCHDAGSHCGDAEHGAAGSRTRLPWRAGTAAAGSTAT